ncbi:MAG: DUF4382 domain-containing protein [Candidatus Bathyarchaeota archaeon]|nr:DUF4382 domain-containing protein [Candidatus Bathyarchaeum sp.]
MEVKSKTVGLRVAAGVLIAATIIVAVFASGIELPSTQSLSSVAMDTGRLTVLLTDAPVDVDELWIEISDLAVHSAGDGDGEWVPIDFSVVGPTLTFDLLTYQDGETLPLADVELDAGSYNKIRMSVLEANATYYRVDDEGNEYIEEVPLKVPSGHIDVITNFNITAAEEVVVLIDMQPDWVSISHSNNLRPVLKATVSQAKEENTDA